MKIKSIITGLFVGIIFLAVVAEGQESSRELSGKFRIMVVDSYHRGYDWADETHNGFSAAMLKLGYFDNEKQVEEFNSNDQVQTLNAVVKRLWMDSKRKSSKAEIDEASLQVYETIKDFKPDIIFLGDDNAANYIGRQFLDTETPVVFWGVNNTPIKYGLVDSEEKPGHNVTGIYQSGYYIESMELLTKIVPGLKTFAVLSENTPTGRSHYKKIEYLDHNNMLPLKLVEIVATNNFEEWKTKALELQDKVDAFYVAPFAALVDENNKPVAESAVAEWYVSHINIPEASLGARVKNGMLCAAEDSAYKQGFDAVLIGHDILANGADPATYRPQTPARGALMVNKKRAERLGIKLAPEMGIDKIIE